MTTSASTARTVADLVGWTPVDVGLETDTPWVDWGDLRGLRFDEPFVDGTISRWAFAEPPPGIVRTGLEALAALDAAPSLDPVGFIFHLSRCGSTLLSRLLRQCPGCLVLSEAEIINKVLLAPSGVLDRDDKVQLLRWLLRALGRRRFGDERHLIVKVSSWNVLHAELFSAAFPEAGLVWLQRAPAEVIASMVRRPPSWLGLAPADLAPLIGVAEHEVPTLGLVEKCARSLGRMLTAAHGLEAPVIDYADLPDAAWMRVARQFGVQPTASDVGRMRKEARYSAKDGDGRLFNAAADTATLTDAARAAAARHADALYASLRSRRLS